MLDPNLIKFVEPIGPGQIVDRASLVAIPVGYIQVGIENKGTEIVVKVTGIRGITSGDGDTSYWPIKTYVWQNGAVVAGEEIISSPEQPRNRRQSKMQSFRRRRSVDHAFRFRKDPAQTVDGTVDGILQVCVFRASNGTIQRKSFVGTVHIALKCITQANSSSCLRPREEWYKIFPKSAFLPGSPSDIARTDCYISGLHEEEDEVEGDEVFLDGAFQEAKSEGSVTSSTSVVSFSQFRLEHTRTPSIFTSPGNLMHRRRISQRDQNETSSRVPKTVLIKWLRMQKSFDEEKTTFCKGRRLTVDVESPMLSTSGPPACPFLVGSPSHGSDSLFQSLTTLDRRSDRTSCSAGSSSTDVGYESSRSGSSAESDRTSDEKKNTKSKFRMGFGKAWSFRSSSRSKSDASAAVAIPIATKSVSSPPTGRVAPKSRSFKLQRSHRIPGTKTFTSLSEIGKKDLSVLPEQCSVH